MLLNIFGIDNYVNKIMTHTEVHVSCSKISALSSPDMANCGDKPNWCTCILLLISTTVASTWIFQHQYKYHQLPRLATVIKIPLFPNIFFCHLPELLVCNLSSSTFRFPTQRLSKDLFLTAMSLLKFNRSSMLHIWLNLYSLRRLLWCKTKRHCRADRPDCLPL